MKYSKAILALFILFASVIVASAETKYEDVEIKTIPVAGSIYMLEGQGGNIGVSVGEDGVLMIDDQFAPLSDKILKAISNLGGDKPEFILNTHWHGDHTGGNEPFGAMGGTIIAHENVRKRLMTRQEVKLFDMVSEPQSKAGLPVITFDENLTVHFNGEEVKLFHFERGHTDGDSVIFFSQSNVVHVGDHFFNGFYPFVDIDSGGDVVNYTENVGEIIEHLNEETKIIPGHGPLSNLAEFRAFHKMLLETTAIVQAAFNEGKTKEEIVAAGFPDEIEEKWGQGFLNTEQWIHIIYDSLNKYKNK